MKTNDAKLAPPWVIYFNQIEAMFKEDPDIQTEFDNEAKIITLKVNGDDKADAITQLLPTEKTFGNVVVKVNVVPANKENNLYDLFRKAFSGNPIISEFISTETLWGTLNFVVFKPKVVQYYTDDMFDVNGLRTTVYQDLAKELFEIDDEIFFCTEKENN